LVEIGELYLQFYQEMKPVAGMCNIKLLQKDTIIFLTSIFIIINVKTVSLKHSVRAIRS